MTHTQKQVALVILVVALLMGFMHEDANKFTKECNKHGAFYITNCNK